MIENRGKRKINSFSNLCNYLVCPTYNQELIITVPNSYEPDQYFTTRDKIKPENTIGFQKIHKYDSEDFNYFRELAYLFSKVRFHNDSISIKFYDAISEYVTQIPSFPNSLKIKKSDEEEL